MLYCCSISNNVNGEVAFIPVSVCITTFACLSFMPTIKGTASVGDEQRAQNKALIKTKFPPSFREIVNISKVNRVVMAAWIERKISESLGFEDEIVQNTAVNLFLPEDLFNNNNNVEFNNSNNNNNNNMSKHRVDPKKAQIDLSGFLGDQSAAKLCKEIWETLIDAAKEETGIPRMLLEEKKKEMAAANVVATIDRDQATRDQLPQQQQPMQASRNNNNRNRWGPENNRHGGANHERCRLARSVSPPDRRGVDDHRCDPRDVQRDSRRGGDRYFDSRGGGGRGGLPPFPNDRLYGGPYGGLPPVVPQGGSYYRRREDRYRHERPLPLPPFPHHHNNARPQDDHDDDEEEAKEPINEVVYDEYGRRLHHHNVRRRSRSVNRRSRSVSRSSTSSARGSTGSSTSSQSSRSSGYQHRRRRRRRDSHSRH